MLTPVIFWKGENYTNTRNDVTFGEYASLTLLGAQLNSMSSIKIDALTTVILYDGLNFTGMSKTLTGPLSMPSLNPIGFNDRPESMKVLFNNPPLSTQVACCRGINTNQCGPYLPGTARCDNTFATYCVTSMDGDCKNWCAKNPALCDDLVKQWCVSHPTDPYCACINSKLNSKQSVNPKCFDPACIKYGYQTQSMAQTNCPSTVTCEMQVNLQNSGTQFATYVPLEQNCGGTSTVRSAQPNSSTTIGASGATAATVTAIPNNSIPTSSGRSYGLIYLFIFMILVVILGIIYAMLYMEDTVATTESV
jgi:hypothetical protein